MEARSPRSDVMFFKLGAGKGIRCADNALQIRASGDLPRTWRRAQATPGQIKMLNGARIRDGNIKPEDLTRGQAAAKVSKKRCNVLQTWCWQRYPLRGQCSPDPSQWRSSTPGQIKMLNGARIRDGNIKPEDLTRGQAADMITTHYPIKPRLARP
jgi:hypothetical protein